MFCEVLLELSVEFVVVDGEADKDIVQLANFHSCPVLSNDSDFYIYNLKGGFINMEKFSWESKPIKAEVYYMKAMVDQFKFAHDSLRFIIPAIFGNDFITSLTIEPHCREFIKHIKQVTSQANSRCHPVLPVVIYASHYDNLKDFTARIASDSIEYLSKSWKKCLLANCVKSSELHDVHEVCSLESLHSKTDLLMKEEHSIPTWLLNQFRQLQLIHLSPPISSVVLALNTQLTTWSVTENKFCTEVVACQGCQHACI